MTAIPSMAREAPTFFPGLVTDRFVATCEFYFEHFGLRPAVADENYMLLVGADGTRLGLLRSGHPDQPAALQRANRGAGVWLNLEVDDPEAQFARLQAAGVEIVAEPEFSLSGVRRFVARDPNGVLLYIAERTVPVPLPGADRGGFSHDHGHSDSVHRLSGH